MKKLTFVLLKALLAMVATIGSLAALETIMMPFAHDKSGMLIMLKVTADGLMALIPILLYIWMFRNEGWAFGFKHPHKIAQLAIGALLGYIFMVGLVGLVTALGGLQIHGIKADAAISGLIFLIVTSFTVSFGEETLFRGLLQGMFRHAYGRAAGIIVSSVIFFILHGANPGMFESVLAPLNLFMGGLLIA